MDTLPHRKNWLKKKVARSTVALMLDASLEIDHGTDTRTVFDMIRTAIEEARAYHSLLVEKNNGIALRHLRRLLIPLGVDVPSDPLLIGSLDTLVKMRHAWAHQYRFGAKTTKSAADAQKTANECLQFAERLYLNAAALRL